MRIEYSARSHVGKVRENNEDNLFVDGTILPAGIGVRPFAIDGCAGSPAIFAVCDGMGGESDGEMASRLAVETLLEHQEQIKDAKPKLLDAEVQSYVTHASQTIVLKTPVGKRSGTTLALTVISKHGLHCFNVGDSRIYIEWRGKLRQITHDHTVAVDLLRANKGQFVQAPKNGHKLTRCMGIGKLPEVEVYPALPPKGRLLICSDGLTKMMRPEEIGRVLEAAPCTAEAADVLLRTALRRGGRDNITLIVLATQRFGPLFLSGNRETDAQALRQLEKDMYGQGLGGPQPQTAHIAENTQERDMNDG